MSIQERRTMDYTQVLDSYGTIIEGDLKEQFLQLARESESYHPFISEVKSTLEEFVMRHGRRLAACSTLMVYKGYAGRIDARIIKVCSAVELFRHSILLHDDIVDKEMERRGGITVHKALEGRYDERFGVGSAIFAGNMLLALAIKSLLSSGFSPDKLVEVVDLVSSEFKDVNESQIIDLLFEYKMPEVEEWEMMAGKRAASLFRASMLTGGLLASADERDLRLLAEAARHIGYAFDIQDDIIDTFASREQYGRDPCGDIAKRKKPLHITLAIKKDRKMASIMHSGGEIEGTGIKEIQDIIRECGALEEAKSISRAHARDAERLISMTMMSQESKDFFVSFIRYVDQSLDWYK
jgi:geranylgeranyl pyrophosphate synthase